jgi:hypothetical protein
MNSQKMMVAAAVAALLSVAANADDRGKPSDTGMNGAYARDDFRALDTDGDGRISRAEAAADRSMGKRFSKLDKNADGYVDDAEYRARGSSRDSGNSSSNEVPSSQSPESASPNSPGKSSQTDPNQQQTDQPRTARPRS